MISFAQQLSDKLKRIDCKFLNPNEKIFQITNSENCIFENFGNYVSVHGGKRLSQDAFVDKSGGIYSIPYIRGEDLKDGIISFENAVKISDEENQKIKKYFLVSGDVCVTNVGTIGSAGFVDRDCLNNFSENLACLRVKDNNKLLPEYLFYYCLSGYAKSQFERFSVGSLQYKLSLDSIRNECKIILPIKDGKIDLNKQHDIVNSIKQILTKQFVLKEKIQNKIRETNNILEKSLKIKDFSKEKKNKYAVDISSGNRLDALYNNPGYCALKVYLETIETISLTDCLIFNTKKESSYKEFYDVVDLANIDDDIGEISNTKTLSVLDSDKIVLNADNIIISKLQTNKIKVAMVTKNNDLSCGSSELLQFEVKPGYDKKYIFYAIRTQIVKQQWEYNLVGSSRMRINKEIILNTKIPYPSKEAVRSEIVSLIDSNITQIKEFKSRLKDITTIVTNIFEEYFKI